MWRNIDRASGHQPHVGNHPFKAILGEQTDPVARLNARLDECRSAGQSVGTIDVIANSVKKAVTAKSQGRSIAQAISLKPMQLDEVAVHHAETPFAPRPDRKRGPL